MIDFPGCHFGNQIPLFRCIVQSDGSSLNGAHTMLDDFYSRILLVIKASIKTITEYQYINPSSLKIILFVQFHILRLSKGRSNKTYGQQNLFRIVSHCDLSF